MQRARFVSASAGEQRRDFKVNRAYAIRFSTQTKRASARNKTPPFLVEYRVRCREEASPNDNWSKVFGPALNVRAFARALCVKFVGMPVQQLVSA